MGEGVFEAVKGGRDDHGDFVANGLNERANVGGMVLGGCRVELHVKEREFDLAQRLQARLIVLGGDHPVKQSLWKWLAAVDLGAHGAHNIPFPAEVLHELTW